MKEVAPIYFSPDVVAVELEGAVWGAITVVPPQEVSIWLEPKRKRRLKLPRDLLEAIQQYLELKVKQNA